MTQIEIGRKKSAFTDLRHNRRVLKTDAVGGDQGKGKLGSVLEVDIDVKDTGAHNAGHNVVGPFGEFGLGLVPSSMVVNPDALCVIGQDVEIKPRFLVEEIKTIQRAGIEVDSDNFMLDPRSHLILRWHEIRDALSEEARGKESIGSLHLGVGWSISDRVNRKGLRIEDLMAHDWKDRVKSEYKDQLSVIENMKRDVKEKTGKRSKVDTKMDVEEIIHDLESTRSFLHPFIGNTMKVVWDAIDDGKRIGFEDSHGALLDVSNGTWPFTTGTNVALGGVHRSFGGKAVRSIDKIVVAMKPYTTRVGGGPLPTELDHKAFNYFVQQKGGEKGTRSGRDRRCGAFDGPAARYGMEIVGASTDDEIALTKLDVLSGLDEIPVCVAYDSDGVSFSTAPRVDAEFLKQVKPKYVYLKGWQEDISGITNFSDLPIAAKQYVAFIQELMGRKVTMIGTGKHKDATILTRGDRFKYQPNFVRTPGLIYSANR